MTVIATDSPIKLSKREYDIARRPSYAARKAELEKAPQRKAVRTAYLKRRRKSPEIALTLLLNNAKCRAKKYGIEFNIGRGDLKIPLVCPVLGFPFVFGNEDDSYTARDFAPSIDRISNSKGYIPGNVRIISWRANRLKNDAKVAELEAIVRYMKGEISLL